VFGRGNEPSVVTVLTQSGVGCGVVYKAGGTIVTNAHVVAGVQEGTVALADGQQVPGKVRATDKVSDLAVIQANRNGLPAATFQKPLPQVGELAVVMGSPLGFEATVTSGIISGLHRQIPGSASTGAPLVDLIQTDAAISPGNSGGAVLDAQGEVVGMSVAYIPPAAGAVALGFAIPAATVVDVPDQLLATGTARHAYIGIQPATLTPEIARLLGISRTSGVVAMQVETPSPAAEAGIQPGDIVITFNGQETAPGGGSYSGTSRHQTGRSRPVDRATRSQHPRDHGHSGGARRHLAPIFPCAHLTDVSHDRSARCERLSLRCHRWRPVRRRRHQTHPCTRITRRRRPCRHARECLNTRAGVE
jgi:S1-C subfamily serine protease